MSALTIMVNGCILEPDGEGPAMPNVILILADDLGYGDLSCYGQATLHTPHMDRMARDGVLFTNHYTGCKVCASSRASQLTGLYTGHVSCFRDFMPSYCELAGRKQRNLIFC